MVEYPATEWPPARMASGSPCGLHEQDRRYDVAVAGGPGDHRRPAVEHGVEDGAGVVVPLAVGGRQELAREAGAQRTQVGRGRQRWPPVGRGGGGHGFDGERPAAPVQCYTSQSA